MGGWEGRRGQNMVGTEEITKVIAGEVSTLYSLPLPHSFTHHTMHFHQRGQGST